MYELADITCKRGDLLSFLYKDKGCGWCQEAALTCEAELVIEEALAGATDPFVQHLSPTQNNCLTGGLINITVGLENLVLLGNTLKGFF